jgi:hypothetical protein
MWVIYRDPKNVFDLLDKYTYALVQDEDILEFQTHLAGTTGYAHPIQLENRYLQHFVTFHDKQLEYVARRYDIWSKTQ